MNLAMFSLMKIKIALPIMKEIPVIIMEITLMIIFAEIGIVTFLIEYDTPTAKASMLREIASNIVFKIVMQSFLIRYYRIKPINLSI